MSNNRKEQAIYDYLHNNKVLKGKILAMVEHLFFKLNFSKRYYSKIKWYKHKVNKDNEI